MRVLVIGGSGFIGTRLMSELIGRGEQVQNLDLRPSATYPQLTTIGDVREQATVDAASAGVDAIINLAAEHRDDVRPVSRYESVNVGGAKVVVQAAQTNGVQRIIFTSTVAVYGLGQVMPNEQSPTEPFNEYGRTKLAAEQVLKQWATSDARRSLAIVRPAVVFGEANRGNVYTLMNQMSARMFVMVGKGQNHKSMGYVGNVAAFLATQLTAPTGTQTTNYADKPDLTVRQLVAIARAELGGHPLLPFALPYWLGLLLGLGFDLVATLTRKPLPISSVRVRKFCAETSIDTACAQASGFEPKFALQGALERTIRAEFGG